MDFLARLLISALSLALAAYIVPGFRISGTTTYVLAALLLSVLNALVRPVLFFLTLPITVITLGLFVFVLNAAMLALVAWILPGFSIANFGAALLGWLIVALTNWVASNTVKKMH